MLSCSTLVARADGHSVHTLEGLQDEASEFVGFIADQGAEQCGFCNPGFVMNTIALLRENPDPTDDEILSYLSGNLCRCSGTWVSCEVFATFSPAETWKGALVNRPDYQSVGKSVRKKDSLQLLLGKPVFTEDIAPDAPCGEALAKPSANAIVEDIDTSKAKKIAGVVDVFTWEDVPGSASATRDRPILRQAPTTA